MAQDNSERRDGHLTEASDDEGHETHATAQELSLSGFAKSTFSTPPATLVGVTDPTAEVVAKYGMSA